MDTSKKVQATKTISAATDLIGVQIGDFVIEKFLAQGGMAVVYRGTQITLKRPVAIKILKTKLSRSPKMIARFNREVEALSTLSHPNIVSIFGKGKARINNEEHYFFAMEYVEGKSLRNAIRDNRLDETSTYRLILEILDGLDYAHQKRIIHRDIKPENLLLTPQNHIKITDFGIAHIEASEDEKNLTEENVGIGTKAYMAPEQGTDSRSVDARADLYSVGVLLYEMLTGVIPRGVFEPATVINKTLEFPIDPIIFKAMAHDREKRYASAREMYEKLEEFLQTSYIEQHRQQTIATQLPPKPSKRKHPFLLFFFLSAIALTIALIVSPPLREKTQQLLLTLQQKIQQATKDPKELNPLKNTDPQKNPPDETKNPPDETKNPPDEVKNPPDETKNPPDETKNPPDETKNPPDEVKNPPDEVKNPPDETKNPPDEIKNLPPPKYFSEGECFFWIATHLLKNRNYATAKDYFNRARSDRSLTQKIEEKLQQLNSELKQKEQAHTYEEHALKWMKLKKYADAIPFFEDAKRLSPSLNLNIWIDKCQLGAQDEKKMLEYEEKLKNTFLYMGYGHWGEAKGFLEEIARLYPASQIVEPLKNYITGLDTPSNNMVWVKLGRFPRGASSEKVFLSSYFIDKYEVSQAEYAKFVQASSYPPPKDWNGQPHPPLGKENHPVSYVHYHDALAYALYCKKQLPTEAQWEKAARDASGRIYPWGNELNLKVCHFNQSSSAVSVSVDSFPEGASSYGCLQMAGNVWEWCRDFYQEKYDSQMKNPQGSEQGLERVVRGGSFSSNDPEQLKTFTRHHLPPDHLLPDLGFRLVLEVNIPEALDY